MQHHTRAQTSSSCRCPVVDDIISILITEIKQVDERQGTRRQALGSARSAPTTVATEDVAGVPIVASAGTYTWTKWAKGISVLTAECIGVVRDEDCHEGTEKKSTDPDHAERESRVWLTLLWVPLYRCLPALALPDQ